MTSTDGETMWSLSVDPVYRAAVDRAQSPTREELEIIGLRSAEISAVNQALTAGSKLEDLVGGPVALTERPRAHR